MLTKGRIFSEEHIKKLSESHMGQVAWNKGLKGCYITSLETRRKLSEAGKGKHNHSIETREKISKANTGYRHTEEAKRKMSESRRKENLSEETIKRMSEAHKGKHLSEEGKIKLSIFFTGRKLPPLSEERKKKLIKANTGRHPSKEARQKMSESHKRKNLSEETRQKLSECHRGSKHPNWQGGKSFEPYSPEFNRQLKELIRQRDNYQCQLCGMPEIENITKLTVHHIDYVKKNCLPDNLIALCKSCNFKVNINRKYWTEYFLKEEV